jgi:hypothetical protein
MGKVKTMYEAQIRGEKNKETAWGKKDDDGRRRCIVTILEEVGPKVMESTLAPKQ